MTIKLIKKNLQQRVLQVVLHGFPFNTISSFLGSPLKIFVYGVLQLLYFVDDGWFKALV